MALSIATGTDGSFTHGDHFLKFDSWSAVIRQVVNDITGFDSSGFEENIGGLKGCDFSATGHIKYGASSTSPGLPTKVGGAVLLTLASGCTVGFTAIVGAVPLSSVVQGAASGGLSGRSTGTIALTWAVT